MTKLKFQISISLDGYVAGPEQSLDNLRNIGATIMGRNMFGGGPGDWGDEPPFHTPVYVLTHLSFRPTA